VGGLERGAFAMNGASIFWFSPISFSMSSQTNCGLLPLAGGVDGLVLEAVKTSRSKSSRSSR
jgi:hypothetical protein